MAKKSMVARDVKRRKLAAKHARRRAELKKLAQDESLDYDARWQAMIDLQRLPRDSSVCRQRNRCAISGRPRGYFRRFGLSRNMLREMILRGEAPGVVKSSW
ncbi:MAG: 30S ribosomal protein S14 [Gammaproteobacteria bacterium]|nr:30S ribosomal protein S14 [Gammaproteobacteria bacterium]